MQSCFFCWRAPKCNWSTLTLTYNQGVYYHSRGYRAPFPSFIIFTICESWQTISECNRSSSACSLFCNLFFWLFTLSSSTIFSTYNDGCTIVGFGDFHFWACSANFLIWLVISSSLGNLHCFNTSAFIHSACASITGNFSNKSFVLVFVFSLQHFKSYLLLIPVEYMRIQRNKWRISVYW